MKIKVIIPAKGKKWKVTFLDKGNYTANSRTKAALLYSLIEAKVSRFSKARLQGRTQVVVDYGVLHPLEPNDWKNEGFYDTQEATLYALASFLEDYLPQVYLREKLKKYFRSEVSS